MAVTPSSMVRWCEKLLGADAGEARLSLQDYLAAIGRLDSLADLPSGSVVLVRGDVDAKPGAKIGEGDIRLRSMLDTLNFGRQHGWKQVVFGHLGRKPEGTLAAVARRLGQLLGVDTPLVENWFDEGSGTITEAAAGQIRQAPPGGVLVLENTRRYQVERLLWKAQPSDLPNLAPALARFANEMAEKISPVYVNEAFSAGSLDSSTTVVPAAMERVALGRYVAGEFDGPMVRCLEAKLVVFSGLKADKLDDLQAMIDRGTVEMVFTAGSLAMALNKAAAELDGKTFSLGLAEAAEAADKPFYVSRERIEQAKRMIAEGRKKGIEFVLPVDFVLQDGRIAAEIGPQDQQFDVGPATSELFAQKIGEFIDRRRGRSVVAFYNGVFGMFEDARFAEGTRKFIGQLRRLKEGSVEVYVGGGEGGAALDLYGRADDVAHCFTAGGTVLNALGGQPVPYLVALRLASLSGK